MGRQWKQCQTLFWGAPKSLQMVIAAMKLKDASWKKSCDQSRQHIKKQRHYLPTKIHVVMYGCECWPIKKTECQRIDAFELWCWRRLLRVPWIARRPNQFILKEISPGCSLEGLMLKLKLQLLWPPDAKSRLIWKDPDAGKNWRWEEKGTTEDEKVGWYHRLDGHEFE